MNRSLQRTSSAVATGSIADVARQTGQSIPRVVAECELAVLIDQSGSMSAHDARGGMSRYEAAAEELAKIQARYPGKILLAEFADATQWCYAGVPTGNVGVGTNMARGLEFMRIVDGALDIVVISDGEPDSREDALRVAGTFQSRIHTIYIGPEGGEGQGFLRQLAAKGGGREFVADAPGELAPGVIALLEG